MAKKNGNGSSVFFDKILPTMYSLGAAVVILGALGKIQHWEGGGTILTIGLLTEVAIFVLFAFQTFAQNTQKEPDWSRVYPELADDYDGELPQRRPALQSSGLTANMDKMLADAKVSPDIFEKLGTGLRSFTDTVGKMRDVSEATIATNEYTQNVRQAAGSINEMNKSYGVAVTSMNAMADATQDAKEYRMQFQKITQSMGALNAVYELELQDTNKHLKAMNAFYGNLTSAMENMSEASRDTQQFKGELSKLTNNLASLNNVYGSMLTAMRGNTNGK
ncbi:type IX secretion system motor protein PorL/GldL [Larkinella knui]|uniref:Gliding motility protein GldL n=1 Tax=Larkinella knui TaxID=2025310 RepID=A0A3P1CF25_9BACT|nr:gliding motility protein GldL [Larkinella knui]RRB11696.1 gliding motility protein GldL [Larkinella knui]